MQLGGHDLPEAQQQRWVYDFESGERIKVYLTNTLQAPEHDYPQASFLGSTRIVAEEAQQASSIKEDLPIMVVLGNPPYSGHSANDNPWIDGLLKGELPDGTRVRSYYEVDGHPLREKNTKWLQDDYVKFIRFAQWRIEQTGAGVLAYITNHGYLDNPTFRGMRESLLETFTEIFILNLHGNVLRKETAPGGLPDENVFDIKQGVAIGIHVRTPGQNRAATVHHADLWGTRESKYRTLAETDVRTTEWHRAEPHSPFYFFMPQDLEREEEYRAGIQITELLPTSVFGLVTARDSLTIRDSASEVWKVINDFVSLPPEEARQKYDLRADSRDWKVHLAQEDVLMDGPDRGKIVPILYRCFDVRFTYYTGRSKGFLCMPRGEVMRHMIAGDNIALVANRQIVDTGIRHFWVSRHVLDLHVMQTAHASAYLFPLYLYPDEGTVALFDDTATSPWPPDPGHNDRVPNLSEGFVEDFEDKLGISFDPHKTDNVPGETFGPRDVLAYIYAVFHSPTYRERYAEFLKIDFPRVPVTSDVDLFWNLVKLGSELIDLHLMEHAKLSKLITSYPVPGDDRVKRRGGFPKLIPAGESRTKTGEVAEKNRVYINLKQYFKGVPRDAWEFEVGGYQVLHKWLKDRKGRKLSYEDKVHYQKIAVALKETIRLMEEIDQTIPQWPVE